MLNNAVMNNGQWSWAIQGIDRIASSVDNIEKHAAIFYSIALNQLGYEEPLSLSTKLSAMSDESILTVVARWLEEGSKASEGWETFRTGSMFL